MTHIIPPFKNSMKVVHKICYTNHILLSNEDLNEINFVNLNASIAKKK